MVDEMCDKHPELNDYRLKGSAFAATTFNLGGKAWTVAHRDFLNFAFWFCAVTALGEFDPSEEGHLVLAELRIIIEFPPGSTILFPSALITHWNVPVLKGTRASIVQYTPGGLIRYAECGFRTLKAMEKDDPEAHAAYFASVQQRVKHGLAFFERLGKHLSSV